MKKKIIIIGIIILIISIFICLYPKIEYYKGEYLYMMSYGKNFENSSDYIELEGDTCYDESYSYNKKRDISIISWDYKEFLFFKWFKIKYKEGNICDTEFLLEESYIEYFLKNAQIIEKSSDFDLSELIKGKEAIVGNKRYRYNENHLWIGYILNDEYKDMFIYNNEDGLLVIQVGLGDEGPKYIAYK